MRSLLNHNYLGAKDVFQMICSNYGLYFGMLKSFEVLEKHQCFFKNTDPDMAISFSHFQDPEKLFQNKDFHVEIYIMTVTSNTMPSPTF